MEHYICKGTCGSESKFKGVCQSEGCDREGTPLAACHCDDGQHYNEPASPVEPAVTDSDSGIAPDSETASNTEVNL